MYKPPVSAWVTIWMHQARHVSTKGATNFQPTRRKRDQRRKTSFPHAQRQNLPALISPLSMGFAMKTWITIWKLKAITAHMMMHMKCVTLTDSVRRWAIGVMNVRNVYLFIPEINKNSKQINSTPPLSKNTPVFFLKSQGWQVWPYGAGL